jgi:hypothetical protein
MSLVFYSEKTALRELIERAKHVRYVGQAERRWVNKPKVASRIHQIVYMGGAVRASHNDAGLRVA